MLSSASIKKIKKIYHNNPLIIEGANGSLGLSFLSIFKEFKIQPKKLILTTKSSKIDKDWKNFDKSLVHLTSNNKNFFNSRKKYLTNLKKVNILFCAGYGRPNIFLNDQKGVIEANILNLIEYTKYKNIKTFAYMSTSEVYSGVSGSVTEKSKLITSPDHPRGIYIETKRLSESIISNILSKNIHRSASFRVALAFPPKLLKYDNRVLSDLISNAKKNGYVSLKGGSNFIRQYQYGPHCALKILAAMAYGKSNLYNNSGNFILKLGDLGKLISKILKIKFIDMNKKNNDVTAPKKVLVNSNLLNKEIGYQIKKEKKLEYYLTKMISSKHV